MTVSGEKRRPGVFEVVDVIVTGLTLRPEGGPLGGIGATMELVLTDDGAALTALLAAFQEHREIRLVLVAR